MRFRALARLQSGYVKRVFTGAIKSLRRYCLREALSTYWVWCAVGLTVTTKMPTLTGQPYDAQGKHRRGYPVERYTLDSDLLLSAKLVQTMSSL